MSLTNSPVYRLTHRVIYGDTDAGGVVYNANFLRYFEKGRTEMMRDWVCSYREIEALGLVLPVTECFARYKSPAFYDDLLDIETSIAELRKFSCRFNYRIYQKRRSSLKANADRQGIYDPRRRHQGRKAHPASGRHHDKTSEPFHKH